jgi:hypothetical protein
MFPEQVRVLPVKLFPCKFKNSNLGRTHISSEGMFPMRFLPPIDKMCKLELKKNH